eukprot:jgi/Chrzof1/15195/Cz09g31070.t1
MSTDLQLSGSDDEAPEEVTNLVGKDTAVQQRKKESKARLASKRKARAPSEPATADAAQQSEQEDLLAQPTTSAAEQIQEQPADLLSLEIIEQLAERRRSGQVGSTTSQLDSLIQPNQQQQVRKKQKLLEVRKGPVSVRVLSRNQPRQPSKSATSFQREQLLGTRVKRSANMLLPAASYVMRPADKFV